MVLEAQVEVVVVGRMEVVVVIILVMEEVVVVGIIPGQRVTHTLAVVVPPIGAGIGAGAGLPGDGPGGGLGPPVVS